MVISDCETGVIVLRNEQRVLPTIWSVSDEFWEKLKPTLAAAMAKARFGGEQTGSNPTDRAKPGTKRSVLVETDGCPLLRSGEPNVHDCRLLEATLEAIIVECPNPQEVEQHLCLDKGYDNSTGRDAVDKHYYIPHIRRIDEEKLDKQQQKCYPARRWVVERTLGWLSKCRAILIRYDKKTCNYLGMIKIACALLWYRRCWRLSHAV